MSLLPPNSTAFEQAVEAVTARLTALDVPIADLWRPETCPASHLPWLAHALSVDDWRAEWPEAVQRAVIAASVDMHRKKGTIASVKQFMAAAGYGTATIQLAAAQPRIGMRRRLGTGDWRIGGVGHWADYSVQITDPISQRQYQALAGLLENVAPVRCRLRRISVAGLRLAIRPYDPPAMTWPLSIRADSTIRVSSTTITADRI